ncbi:myb-like protein A isoform X2 [Monomorium pharaonis]|nr:myb-like protein A isoform X2 [Monomorium pharaonis]
MSPTSRMDDWPPPRDHDDPVLLRVTPHHPLQQQHHHHHNNHQQQHSDLSKSYSVDALHHRLEERCPQQHSAEVVNKLSHDLNKKLQASDVRSRTNENNNNDNLEDRHQHHHHHYQEKRHPEKRHDYVEQRRERLSPQSVEVLNDRNRQLERERRKLAASCEPLPQNREQLREISGPLPITGDDIFRERSATIEMTSQNIELLNRRNEKRMNSVSSSNSTMSTYSISTTASSVATSNDNGWARRHETQSSIEATIFSDRPPPPTSSPPRSPNNVETISPRGAIPRRSGSCSSTSSSGRSIDARVSPRALLSRSSPKSSLDSLTRNEARIEYASTRKVSSPTQTDNTGSWNRSNSPSRLSHTSDAESRIERLSASSKFRTGGRSSTSSSSSVSKASSSSSPRNSPVEEDKSSPRSSLCVSPQPGIEGLTLVQRTEVVLRVNAATSDAASQTDILEDTEQDASKIQRPLPESRKKLPEEIECEELSKDLASQLSPNDKLVPILVPAPEHKKPTDYVSGLFRVEATLQPRTRRRLSLEESTASCGEDVDVDDKK